MAMPVGPEVPGYETVEVKLLTVYPPIYAEVVLMALGGGYSTGMPGVCMPGAREVRVNSHGHIELWEKRTQLKED